MLHGLALAIGFRLAGTAFKEITRWHLQSVRNLHKATRTNSIATLFVFLDLLEREADGIGQLFLAHAEFKPPRTDARANVYINWFRYFLRHGHLSQFGWFVHCSRVRRAWRL